MHLVVVLGLSSRVPPLAPANADASQGGGQIGLEEAFERFARYAEADHTGGVVDLFDRLGRYDPAAAREEPRAHGQCVGNIRSGAVHRALDPADGTTLTVGDEETIQPTEVGSGDGHCVRT
jgi:hypothetical protein